MNKLTLSCLKSLVQTRPKGDWEFLTKMALSWPEAKKYYWNRQGFRTLLGSWPMTAFFDQVISEIPFLCLPGNRPSMQIHGFLVEKVHGRVQIRVYEEGTFLIKLSYKGDMIPWNQQDMKVSVYQGCIRIPLNMNPQALDKLYKDSPKIKQKVIRVLNMARELGKTDIKTLNTLAVLTYKSLNQGLTMFDSS